MAQTDKQANTGLSHSGSVQGGNQTMTPQAPDMRGNKQSHAEDGQSFVLVDSEQGLDIGDDLFAIGEVRRADRLPHHQGGHAGQSRQSADDAPDVTGTTGV